MVRELTKVKDLRGKQELCNLALKEITLPDFWV
jgi:hypothetical protein